MPDAQTSALPLDTATKLTAFARACKAAARAVSLYPPEHPAIGDALSRLARSAAAATERGPLAMLVTPDNLLVGGRTTPRPDQALSELARLLHGHLVGELTIQRDVDPSAWRTLLTLLAKEPMELRAHGGIARALTTAGGVGIEIQELDYSGIVHERDAGMEASWDTIIAYCLQTDALDLDEKTLRILSDIARDPARLAEFFSRTEEQPGPQTKHERAAGLLRALKGVAGFFSREAPDQLGGVLNNMASAASHLSPELMLDVLGIGREPDGEHASLVADITGRITDPNLGRFVARSVASERGCTSRLADAFRALVPDERRQQSVLEIAKGELSNSPFGEEVGFDRVWSQVEDMLSSYSDKAYVPESYNLEMSTARSRAVDFEHLADDPPERVIGWLRTVSDTSIRSMDLQLQADLLLIETDAGRRQELLQLVVSQIDELAALGDFDGARQLVEAMAAVAQGPAPEAKAQVARATEQLVAGHLMAQLALHLNTIRDEEFEPVKTFCAAVGPGLVPRLAETLAGEARPRARQRMTDLLIAFGSHGRHSVDQLRQSPNPSVRRTAVQLLRTFGGAEALGDLEELLDDPESGVQREAVRALIAIGTEEAFARLQKVLDSEADRSRKAVMEELASTRDPNATPLFCYLVRNVECRGKLRETYLKALGRLGLLGGTEAVVALAEVLRKGWWWAPMRTREMRTEAAAALAQIALPEAREALQAAASDGSFGVRSIAKKYVT